MDVSKLERDEQLVLLGLYHWVIHADDIVSDEEIQAFRNLRRRVSDPDWQTLLEDAQERFPDSHSLAHGCRDVRRPEARKCIYDELVELAGVDAFHPDEIRILNWLAVVWGFVSRAEATRAEAALREGSPPEEEDAFDLFGD